MTAKLIGNNHDGANYQAQAVLAMEAHNAKVREINGGAQ